MTPPGLTVAGERAHVKGPLPGVGGGGAPKKDGVCSEQDDMDVARVDS